MRKLKVSLLLLFSMLLSLCLFACTPSDPGTEDPENPEPSEQDQITRADFVNDNSTITLTDAETYTRYHRYEIDFVNGTADRDHTQPLFIYR